MVTAEAEPRAEIFEKMYVGLCFACVIFGLWKGWEGDLERKSGAHYRERLIRARVSQSAFSNLFNKASFFCVFCLYTFLFVGE